MSAAADTRRTALAFLHAYWRGDLAAIHELVASTAIIELPRSTPLPSPAPLLDVIPLIFEQAYPRFRDRRFDIAVERCVIDDRVALVEYQATGTLVSGRTFCCRYLVVLAVEGGRIVRFRPYTDTKYIDAELFSPPSPAAC
ncbi:MAG: nuclear transport factor 2 family protein [Proteobacteria bacterium]|nr:nuclear transport factor 2 family protein [Pseudomonadota bacterium]